MAQRNKAIYRDGKLELRNPCDLPQGAEVDVLMVSEGVIPPRKPTLPAGANWFRNSWSGCAPSPSHLLHLG